MEEQCALVAELELEFFSSNWLEQNVVFDNGITEGERWMTLNTRMFSFHLSSFWNMLICRPWLLLCVITSIEDFANGSECMEKVPLSTYEPITLFRFDLTNMLLQFRFHGLNLINLINL